MDTQRTRTLLVALAMVPIAGLVVWLATKIARTPEGNYRLLVIGAAMVFMTVVVAIPAVVERFRR